MANELKDLFIESTNVVKEFPTHVRELKDLMSNLESGNMRYAQMSFYVFISNLYIEYNYSNIKIINDFIKFSKLIKQDVQSHHIKLFIEIISNLYRTKIKYNFSIDIDAVKYITNIPNFKNDENKLNVELSSYIIDLINRKKFNALFNLIIQFYDINLSKMAEVKNDLNFLLNSKYDLVCKNIEFINEILYVYIILNLLSSKNRYNPKDDVFSLICFLSLFHEYEILDDDDVLLFKDLSNNYFDSPFDKYAENNVFNKPKNEIFDLLSQLKLEHRIHFYYASNKFKNNTWTGKCEKFVANFGIETDKSLQRMLEIGIFVKKGKFYEIPLELYSELLMLMEESEKRKFHNLVFWTL